jgi:cytochrome c oxidase cbb3-type subunit 3
MSENIARGGKKRMDAHSNTVTTGHEWDGIEELDTPLPRWWMWTFYATIIWSIVYCIVYPAWPTLRGGTEGLLGWHSRAAVTKELADLQETRASVLAKIKGATLEEIEKSPELLSAARMVGGKAFASNCAGCHGAGGQGAKAYPNLNDDEWIWGGKLADIRTTIEHGVRWEADADTRFGSMPAFGRDGLLDVKQISAVADYVRTLAELPDSLPPEELGEKVYAENCSVCHGVDGQGNQKSGSPSLNNGIWLYGSDKPTIVNRIINGGGGVMPAWKGRLDETTIKALTVYVHSMGGGQ